MMVVHGFENNLVVFYIAVIFIDKINYKRCVTIHRQFIVI